jgi:hypothetical protein
MIIEHLVYSIAIAIVFGMIYRRVTGREISWIIVLSAYTPDVDIIADAVFEEDWSYGSGIRCSNSQRFP